MTDTPLDMQVDDPEAIRAKRFQEDFGRAQAHEFTGPPVKRWLFAPLPDGSAIGAAFETEAGQSIKLVIKADDAGYLLGSFGLAWRSVCETVEMAKAPQGKA